MNIVLCLPHSTWTDTAGRRRADHHHDRCSSDYVDERSGWAGAISVGHANPVGICRLRPNEAVAELRLLNTKIVRTKSAKPAAEVTEPRAVASGLKIQPSGECFVWLSFQVGQEMRLVSNNRVG